MTEIRDLDPQWWASAFGEEPEPYPAPETLSRALCRLAAVEGISDLQRDVLDALAPCTSAMLSTENWLASFIAAMVLHDRRTAVSADLEPAQVELLARMAHLIEQPSLRARVADVGWFYGNRSDVTLLDLAIDAYAAAPLARDVWFSAGRIAIERAYQLLRRRGAAGRSRIDTLTASLTDWVLTSDSRDGHMVVDCAEVLREQARPDPETAARVSGHLVRLASTSTLEPRAARLLELEAAEWFGTRDKAARHGCVERAGRTYIAEADARIAAEERAGALVESHFLEDAIKVLQGLPRSYRAANDVETLLSELRARLTRSREHAIEEMMRIESDPTDLSEASCTLVNGCRASSIPRKRSRGSRHCCRRSMPRAYASPPHRASRTACGACSPRRRSARTAGRSLPAPATPTVRPPGTRLSSTSRSTRISPSSV